MNIRENRAGIYLKLLKYSTASLHREPALRLPFGQNPRHHLCSTRPWGSGTEALVFYGFLLDIYSLSMTTWIYSSTCWGRWMPIPGHCFVGVPSPLLDPIWDFIFHMLLLEPDTCMTIISLSANSWHVETARYTGRFIKKFSQTVQCKFSPVLGCEKIAISRTVAVWGDIWLSAGLSKYPK